MKVWHTPTLLLAPPTLRQEWVGAVVIITVLLLGEFVGIGGPIRSGVEWAVIPLNQRMARLLQTLTQPLLYVQSLSTAQRRVQDLERRYAEASAQLGQIDSLKAENQGMREMLAADVLLADQRVISVPIVAYGRPLIVGGSQQGITVGNMVLASQTLMGIVTQISSNQSEVALLSQENGPVILAKTESGIQGLIKGDGKRVLLTEVPIDAAFQVGERVVTQGQEGITPGIFIGRVASVKNQPGSAVQTAVIEQLVSFYESSMVEVR